MLSRCPSGNSGGLISGGGLPKPCATATSLGDILTVALTIIGAIALLMLVITGLRYVVSQGEPTKTAELRRQIIYIALGLIIIGLADAIVTFVVGNAG